MPKFRVGDKIQVVSRRSSYTYEIIDVRVRPGDNKLAYWYKQGGCDSVSLVDDPSHSGFTSKLLYRKIHDTKLGKVLYK